MIKLEKNYLNEIALTLNEKSTIENGFFLFEFISDDTNESKIFTAFDLSTNKARFNKFAITTTESTEDLLNGLINLKTQGYYTYKIYSQTTATNLLISNTTEIVEIGKIHFGAFGTHNLTAYTDNSTTQSVYQ